MRLSHAVLAIMFVLASFIHEAEAGRGRHGRHHKSQPTPSSLRGSPAVQKRHNLDADADGLSRFGSREELRAFIAKKLLVPIGGTGSYYLSEIGGHDSGNSDLYRHARPWVKRFLDKELGFARRKFGHVSKLTSFVRTDEYQASICRSGNRAATCSDDPDRRSLHLTGAAVDISKAGMPSAMLAWMRKRLVQLQKQGLVDAIEERGAFHVFVRKAYGGLADKPHKAKKPHRATKRKRTRRARH